MHAPYINSIFYNIFPWDGKEGGVGETRMEVFFVGEKTNNAAVVYLKSVKKIYIGEKKSLLWLCWT
jgi:hypothetical protein